MKVPPETDGEPMIVLGRRKTAPAIALAFWGFCNKIKKKDSTLGALH
jgi:hypothetical protein